MGTLALSALTGCHLSSYYGGGYYYDDGYYYDYDYGYYYSSESGSRDVLTDITERQQQRIAEVAEEFSTRFGLSEEQSLKLAQTTFDFEMLQNRSEQDLADFARRLYGVNPAEIASAVGRAQIGDSSKLQGLVNEAADHFGTTPATMKEIVKTFHGKALDEQGIRL
jgi:DNA-binding MarR family transcriptional regulator